MSNERLRGSIAAAGLSIEGLASAVEVDPKTVERWITLNRKPHRRHRWAVAKRLDVDEVYLWPAVAEAPQTLNASEAEFVRLYPNRAAVPAPFWRSLLDSARDSLDFLAFAALFLPDTNPDLADVLEERARAGARIRIALGDPAGDAIHRRGDEEGIGASLAERAQIVLSHLAPLIDVPGVEIRLHDTTLYTSIFRSDASMLVNTHVYGTPAAANPVLHLQRVPGGRMFDSYQASFERVWVQARPYEPKATTRR